ncbi:hypothetical protein VKT23_003391 [Stygiomarasmius scandens]|uniref:Zinc finger CHCC-type domain-containing protein n=1 Tax=Marasmiellus scandens TaxID=2682957 RepID=A0ABR1JXT6_9AGAR
MLSRRLLSKARVLKTINRASSSAASSPTPPAIIKTPAPTVGTQAPNYPTTWSANQRPRPTSADGPRFEQTTMEVQPNPLSAMALIAEEPVRMVHGRKAVCDGGGGPLGHPKIYINLDQPGPRACGYCGLRFEQEHHH